jgi:hypothetical protein
MCALLQWISIRGPNASQRSRSLRRLARRECVNCPEVRLPPQKSNEGADGMCTGARRATSAYNNEIL